MMYEHEVETLKAADRGAIRLYVYSPYEPRVPLAIEVRLNTPDITPETIGRKVEDAMRKLARALAERGVVPRA